MKIGVIGLGYVGLPLAMAFARKFPGTVGFDINSEKVSKLKSGQSLPDLVTEGALRESTLVITDQIEDLQSVTFFVVGVPTPIDQNKNPDLGALQMASSLVGSVLKKGDIVVYESTVYPGVTEEFCGPILERVSGLVSGVDFKLGYSPERINPGDSDRTVEKILKVVSGQDRDTLETVAQTYGAVIEAGVYKAASIQVAEAAKVIENTQRDLNIALMNELAIIFDKLGLRTHDVLEAAGTKWNFLKFIPGLVGGHCIGVDPYYLTAKAELVGYHPEVILAGRRINDSMGSYVAQRTVKLMARSGITPFNARVGVFGLSFKENVSDIRNSRVPDIISELKDFGCEVLIHDPLAVPSEAHEEYGVELASDREMSNLDAAVFCVPHKQYLENGASFFVKCLKEPGVFVDVKGVFIHDHFPKEVMYWSL